MTPFGWRCVCALFGILMVPVCYAFMPEYLDCLIRGGADGVRFYAFYLVENRNTRCDSGLFYPVLSGYPVKKVFAEQWLEWLESWVLS